MRERGPSYIVSKGKLEWICRVGGFRLESLEPCEAPAVPDVDDLRAAYRAADADARRDVDEVASAVNRLWDVLARCCPHSAPYDEAVRLLEACELVADASILAVEEP